MCEAHAQIWAVPSTLRTHNQAPWTVARRASQTPHANTLYSSETSGQVRVNRRRSCARHGRLARSRSRALARPHLRNPPLDALAHRAGACCACGASN